MNASDGSFFDRFPSANRPRQVIVALQELGPVGAAFEKFAQAILAGGRLPPALRELAILRVAFQRGSSYVYGGHALIAQDVGLRFPPSDGRWGSLETIAVEATDRLLAGTFDDATRLRTIRALGRRRAVELAVVVGQYTLLSMVVSLLDLSPEPGSPTTPLVWPGPTPGSAR
jgi:4-carboxymuconolactone decarboxylase